MRNEILRNQLEKQGMTPEVIEEFIKNVELEEFEAENDLKRLLKVKEVSEYLVKNLDKTWNQAKVRRHIASNELKTVNQVNRQAEGATVSTKTGYRVHLDVLNEFVVEMKMSKDDWKNEAKKYKKLYENLKATMSDTEPQRTTQEGEKEEGVKTLPIEVKSEKDPIAEPVELDEFDFSRVEVKYPKKPRETSQNRYEVDFSLNGERFTAAVAKLGETLSILGAESLERAMNLDASTHEDYILELEKVLIPKIEKKIK